LQLSQTHTTSDQVVRIRAKVSELHHRIDNITAQTRTLDAANRAEIVRRAEEAGAAIARLEWALDRAIAE
jgi:hypothetical protein